MFTRICITVTIIIIAIIIFTSHVQSHGWYSSYCCDDKDCSEVISKEDTGHGSWIVTSKNGMVLVPHDFPKLPSQDEKDHVCMFFDGTKMILRCYYASTGM